MYIYIYIYIYCNITIRLSQFRNIGISECQNVTGPNKVLAVEVGANSVRNISTVHESSVQWERGSKSEFSKKYQHSTSEFGTFSVQGQFRNINPVRQTQQFRERYFSSVKATSVRHSSTVGATSVRFRTGVSLLTEYCGLQYSYCLNILYWKSPTEWTFCTGIFLLVD